MYKVIKYFTDLQDGEHAYQVGDKYPRDGYHPSNERINQLSTKNNAQRQPLIEEIKEVKKEKKATKKK